MKNYIDHENKVKYMDGLLAHSQEWQWFIDLIHETFEIHDVKTWEEYENCNRNISDIFGCFVKIQGVSDGEWLFPKLELADTWEIARFFNGVLSFDECATRIKTTYG